MKNKKIVITFLILIVLCIGVFTYLKLIHNKNNEVDIMPEEEISDEQFRKTMVSLYYKNKNNNELMPEVRLIDVKLLINEPYVTILNLLMESPKNDNLQCVIPEGTKINKIELKS